MQKIHRSNYVLYGLVAVMLLVAIGAWLLRDTGGPVSSPHSASVIEPYTREQPDAGAESLARDADSGVAQGELEVAADAATERGSPEFPVPSTPTNGAAAVEEVIYANDFDRDFEAWEGDKNIWQMGAPVAGPRNLCANDSMCIGTVLDDRYPDFENASLQSPPIDLPEIRTDESIRLNASSWFDVDLNDRARILLSYFDGEFWLDPEVLLVQSGSASRWQQIDLNLSRYAGRKVRLHFVLEQDEKLEGTGNGWYIDDLRLIKKPRSRKQ